MGMNIKLVLSMLGILAVLNIPQTGYAIRTENQTQQAYVQNISSALRNQMQKTTWHQGCPISIADLRLVVTPYWGFDQQAHTGQLIVSKKVASQVAAIFQKLYLAHFSIHSMQPIEYFNGNDDISTAADNTSAFNCRPVTGNARRFSLHSYGLAIDINPLENPYVIGQYFSPKDAAAFLNRQQKQKGMIFENSLVTQLFKHQGWRWGGEFHDLKDFQHMDDPQLISPSNEN